MIEIGVIGAGAMGSGIAQVVAQAGHEVTIIDTNDAALQKAKISLAVTMDKLIEKGKLTAIEAAHIQQRTHYRNTYSDFAKCELVIEAIVENLDIKKKVFAEIETYVSDSCILASNTSSLSLTAIASACKRPDRVIGIHFFNPAPLMALVEVIPAIQTHLVHVAEVKKLVESWKKVPVICKDTPGFIVNRVARPFYGEAIRLYEEGMADFPTIDQAMRDKGFKMGPFELMDLIGNDVNYAVTESVFTAFYYDPRYKPSLTQKKLNEAGWLGRKTGRGYYDYKPDAEKPVSSDNAELKEQCCE
jgi:3-hydroxybutyryl-CoA dehydrogenase